MASSATSLLLALLGEKILIIIPQYLFGVLTLFLV